MQHLLSVWMTLDGQRRIVVGISTIAMFLAIIVLSRLATAPSMSLLYSGLEADSAGEVVQALEQRAVRFEVRGNAIFVDGSQRDALRMTLASEGLPANSSKGYELLDALTGFGTTAQMFDAAYWRAKEGELARTIVSSPLIRTARVFISNTSSQPFQRAITPTASVTVSPTSGALPRSQANALKYLISSAVSGMSPEDVSVIDGRNGVVVSGNETTGGAISGEDRATVLRRNVERLLEARVGVGNAVVEVNVETTTESESIVERKFDPDTRVAISTDTEERSTNANDSRGAGGAVTVASNLPDGGAGGGENSSSSQDTVTRERTNYEVSETTRELLRVPGSIRRISIAVLVDGVVSPDPASNLEIWTARSDAELQDLRDLVASAVGFDASRGDVITLKSLQFDPVTVEGTEVSVSLLQKLNIDVMRLIQITFLSLVALALGMFVVRPILARAPPGERAGLPGLPPPALAGSPGATAAIALSAGAAVAPLPMAAGLPPIAGAPAIQTAPLMQMAQPMQALTGEIDDGTMMPADLSVIQNIPAALGGMAGGGGRAEPLPATADPVERLRQMITDRQDETVDILRTWIDDGEERV